MAQACLAYEKSCVQSLILPKHKKILKITRKMSQSWIVVHACNPRAYEADAGGL
jgi:hypothetical protein